MSNRRTNVTLTITEAPRRSMERTMYHIQDAGGTSYEKVNKARARQIITEYGTNLGWDALTVVAEDAIHRALDMSDLD